MKLRLSIMTVCVGIAVSAVLSACAPEPVAPPKPPSPTDLAKKNFSHYVELIYSAKDWDITSGCFTEGMPEGKAKCYASERGAVGGREIFVRTYIFACDTALEGSCEQYTDTTQAK